jgi:hypothetical protein
MPERESRPQGAAPESSGTTTTSMVAEPAQIRRRREASYRLPPLKDGRRDPDLGPGTRHRCIECKRDVRLRPFVRLCDGSIVCRRCYRDRWAPR